MTVKDFKKIVAAWPETDPNNGEDTDVWVETGWCLSSQLDSVTQLNAADMILISCHKWTDAESPVARLVRESLGQLGPGKFVDLSATDLKALRATSAYRNTET